MFYSAFWLDYLDPRADAFLARFRDQFYAEPRSMTRKGINYGIAGYDITLYFVDAIRQYGPRFLLELDAYKPQLILNNYRFSRVSSAGGYENTAIGFYQFRPDMSIVEIEVPELPGRHDFFSPMDNGKRKYLDYTPR